MLAPIVEIFCDIDDFCKDFLSHQSLHLLPNAQRQRVRLCRLSVSEIMTIMVLFHLSHYRTFKDYYRDCVERDLRHYFPSLVSYNRFVELQSGIVPLLIAWLSRHQGCRTGMYYVDSTTLKVCRNQRITRHKVFNGIAQRGKSSMGWFFGFKLHLAINHQGELMACHLTPGNVDDRKPLKQLLKTLKGIACGDKGYLSKRIEEELLEQGLRLITKVRKNMKDKAKSTLEKFLLAQRAIVETVIEQLKSCCQIEHSRHRSPDNFLVNTLAALVAYQLKPTKPKINQRLISDLTQPLTSN